VHPDLKPLTAGLAAKFAALAGPHGALEAPSEIAPYTQEPRGLYHGASPLVLRPATVEQVSAILHLAHEERIAIVPQGGNTGLVGGQVPFGGEIILSLSRLNRIRNIDAAGNTLTVEAGATLAAVQEAAASAGRLFPLSLGSEGSCQIGGNIASNAGGVHVLRYGNTRDLVLGLEAVLPGGAVIHGLKALRKDNTGYDLKSLLVGSEGTLALITAATLKLFPQPSEVATAFVGLPSLDAAGAFFSRASEGAGPLLTAFELIPRAILDFVFRHLPQHRDPLAARFPWYALVEISSPLGDGVPDRAALSILQAAMEAGIVADAALAASKAQARDFWRLREAIVEAQKYEGGSIKHDVSVPVARIPAFIAEATAAVEAFVPGARPVPFGHFGDGNIHFNVSQPEGGDAGTDKEARKAAYLARWDEMQALVHGIVLKYGGSISAEHGIGRMKADALAEIKSPAEMALLRGIKAAFDPRGVLNPGKVLVGCKGS
jgi:FAD/FMN-containing dehydrogenase